MITIQEARVAKNSLVSMMKLICPFYVSSAITKVGEDYAVKVNVSRELAKTMPKTFHNVPLVFEVVSDAKAYKKEKK